MADADFGELRGGDPLDDLQAVDLDAPRSSGPTPRVIIGIVAAVVALVVAVGGFFLLSGSSSGRSKPTATPKGSQGLTVTVSANPATLVSTPCGAPGITTFTGTIKVERGPVTVKYRWHDDETGLGTSDESVIFPQTGPQSKTVTSQWRVLPGKWGAALKIKSPVELGSNRMIVEMSCENGATPTPSSSAGPGIPGGPNNGVVNPGSGLVRVPAVVQLRQKAAEERIKAAGLVPRVQFVAGSPAGEVLGVSPPQSTQVQKGSTVTITVATTEQIRAENVVDLPRQKAVDILKAQGLNVQVQQGGDGQPGYVVAQHPQGGDKVEPGATIHIVVASEGPSAPPF